MSVAKPFFERSLPLYLVIAARILGPWALEQVRAVPARLRVRR